MMMINQQVIPKIIFSNEQIIQIIYQIAILKQKVIIRIKNLKPKIIPKMNLIKKIKKKERFHYKEVLIRKRRIQRVRK